MLKIAIVLSHRIDHFRYMNVPSLSERGLRVMLVSKEQPVLTISFANITSCVHSPSELDDQLSRR